MLDVQTRYRETYAEFSELTAYSVAVLEAQAGRKPTGDRDFYAERIFGKLVCHALTLKRLSPSPEPTTGELWDVSSSYAIARTLIETYEALAYIALEPVGDQEREFRVLLWKLHAQERRREMLRLIGSNHSEIPKLEENVLQLRARCLNHSFIASAGKELARKVERGETPPYHLSRGERDKRMDVSHDYHTAVIMHLSSHIHTHPFSVHQLFEFKAGDPECLRLMAVPLQYSLAFFAAAVVGILALCPPTTTRMPARLVRSTDTWTGILRRGVNIAG